MDIVSWCKVPRYLHNDLPLGNPLGAPYDRRAQKLSIETALEMIQTMNEPSLQVSSLSWPEGDSWKEIYGQVTKENKPQLLAMGKENRARRAAEKTEGLSR